MGSGNGNDDNPRSKLLSLAISCTVGAAAGFIYWGISQNRKILRRELNPNMAGKVCIVTGGNTGIGKSTARALVEQGAKVIIACRSLAKAEKARHEIVRKTGRNSIEIMELDLSNFQSVRSFAEDFRRKNVPLHVLINNAGIMRKKLEIKEGVESTLVTNHLGPSLLTSLLVPQMKETAVEENVKGRIVNVTSSLEKGGTVDLEDLQWQKRPYDIWQAYRDSKLWNLLWTYELHRRECEGPEALITVNAVSPGVVNTSLNREFPLWMRVLSAPFFKLFMRSPEQGADTSVFVSSSTEVENISGKYFSSCKQKESSDQSYNETLAKKVWKVSKILTGKQK